MAGCPGRDLINWTPDDIFDVPCRECGAPVEFFKDDKRRRCASCGTVMFNPATRAPAPTGAPRPTSARCRATAWAR